MESIATFQEVLDRYGISYTVGTKEESEVTLKMIDNIMSEVFFRGMITEEQINEVLEKCI